ncbi:MAG: hypothetical protein ACRBN8_30105 [Nannocystales bacterium]
MRKLSLIVSLLLPLVACDTAPPATEDSGAQPDPNADRGPLGKADAIGSCEDSEGGDFCGGPSGEGNCWCDDLCEDFGDCCSDKPSVCDGEPAPVELCLQDDQCDSGFCDHTECLSNCPDGMICPAVCWGQCGDEPEPSDCLASSDCGEGEFCEFESECGEGPVGACVATPEVCAEIYAPVCGCDAVTYGNACEAASAGVSVQTQGACPVEPGTCEGSCGGQGNGCWCDDLCEQFGDCCGDYEETCIAADCEALVTAYQEETAAIRSCEDDAECGQVLTGTSCGCTRNWVARTDADIDLWDSLRDDALDASCDIGGISTCDCPPADGFVCNEGVCGWNYL